MLKQRTGSRARQAEIVAQRGALIFAPEQAAALQFRHDLVDEVVEAAGQVGEHDVEAVARLRSSSHSSIWSAMVFARADEGEAGIAAESLGELAHRQVLAPRQIDRALAAALAGVGFRNFGQRAVGVESRGVVAERDRERGDGAGVMDEAVELGPLGARLLDRVADHDEAAGQDLEVVA